MGWSSLEFKHIQIPKTDGLIWIFSRLRRDSIVKDMFRDVTRKTENMKLCI